MPSFLFFPAITRKASAFSLAPKNYFVMKIHSKAQNEEKEFLIR